jgi:hypothetical protein
VYPVFLFPIKPEYFDMFYLGFNHNVISRGTALAGVGVVAYMFGSIINDSTKKKEIGEKQFLTNQIPILLTVITFIILIVLTDFDIFSKKYSGNGTSGFASYLFLLFSALILISIIIEFNNLYFHGCSSLFQLLKVIDKKLFFILVAFLVMFLYLGYRTLPLQILIMIIALFSLFISPIGWKKFLVFAFSGIFFMAFITAFRSTHNIETAKLGYSFKILDSASDLIINNRNLYVAIDYVDTHGVTFGKSMLGNILAPIPFLQSIFYNTFNIDPFTSTSSLFFTTMALGKGASVGLGTNVIADIYLGIGLTGVIILMFLLGYFINNIKVLAQNGDFYHLVSYGVLVSYSVYLVRAEFFFFLRLLIWGLILSNIFRQNQVFQKKIQNI